MTKEELEKEAEEWVISNTEIYDDKFGIEYETEPQAKEAYIAGAEPREKQIEELERKLEQTEKDLADYQFNYPTIKELQKENAELKDDNKVMADNLTKAKEIIRELLNSCFGYNSKTVNYEVKVKAGQFLKEE